MAEEKFRLPKSSYEEVVKIIKGYSLFAGPVGLDDISKQVSVHPTFVSKNVGFLLDVELLEGGRDKQATPRGRHLAQALIHEMPDEIRRLWRTVVNESDFLSRIVGAVRIRQGMDDSTIQSHIAYSAGQPKNSGVMTGTRTVVDILRAAELIREENGKYVAVTINDHDINEVPASPSDIDAVTPQATSISGDLLATNREGVTLRININVQCGPDDLGSLGTQLKQLIDKLNSNQALGLGVNDNETVEQD